MSDNIKSVISLDRIEMFISTYSHLANFNSLTERNVNYSDFLFFLQLVEFFLQNSAIKCYFYILMPLRKILP